MKEQNNNTSAARRRWLIFSNLITFYIPDCILDRKLKRIEVRQAWREKTAFFTIFLLLSAILLFFVAIVPELLCGSINLYTWDTIFKSSGMIMILNGKVYDVTKFVHSHPGPTSKFVSFSGQDVSHVFETEISNDPEFVFPELVTLFKEFKKNDTKRYCVTNFCHANIDKLYNNTFTTKRHFITQKNHILSNDDTFNNNSTNNTTNNTDNNNNNNTINDNNENNENSVNNYLLNAKPKYLGELTLVYKDLYANPNQNWFTLYGKVYNVSEYVYYGHPVYPSQYDHITKRKNMAYYLQTKLNTTILTRLTQDATSEFEAMFDKFERQKYITFLDKTYYAGQLDTRVDKPVCLVVSGFYYLIVGCVVLILLIKFGTSILILYKQYPKCNTDFIIVMIPCYTEGKESIEKTVNSIYDSKYPDKQKLLFLVVDGLSIGKGNKTTTAEIVLNLFNRSLTEKTDFFTYESLNNTKNKVRIFSGWHKNNDHIVPYIIVIKNENRGKRDSQIILFNFLKHVHDINTTNNENSYNIDYDDDDEEYNYNRPIINNKKTSDIPLKVISYKYINSKTHENTSPTYSTKNKVSNEFDCCVVTSPIKEMITKQNIKVHEINANKVYDEKNPIYLKQCPTSSSVNLKENSREKSQETSVNHIHIDVDDDSEFNMPEININIPVNEIENIKEEKEEEKLENVNIGLVKSCEDIKIDPFQYRYMLSVDSDTYIHDDALIQMMYRMEDLNVIALCGETLVSNKLDSWVTAIQVYEYYINHNLNKAFESLFGSVTCLPGCFSFYRIRSTCKRQIPYLINSDILEQYSTTNVDTLHQKCLLSLGEDRFHSLLLSKIFPTKKLKFIIEAKCETVVPNTFKILLSQRRRWINSTLHNLIELLYLERLCGICCFSMRSLIVIDIITTLCLPVSCVYLMYLIYIFSFGLQPIPLTFIIAMSTLASVQILIFVIKRDFIFLFWFIIYILATPFWYVIIPVYSFAKMDDVSWGATRKIQKNVINK
jgi:cellulose synthase/poly-beta-1,6-N-acetylglucosamine synthase-like glycosyltransferase/cytochrome b involved in lipid metabolism